MGEEVSVPGRTVDVSGTQVVHAEIPGAYEVKMMACHSQPL